MFKLLKRPRHATSVNLPIIWVKVDLDFSTGRFGRKKVLTGFEKFYFL